MNFQDKFVAFVDILGFTNLVQRSEAGDGLSPSEILEAMKKLGSPKDEQAYKTHGPRTCPCAPKKTPDVSFRLTQASDCVIVSTEVSPAGAISIISHCWGAVINLLGKGLMCRGFIHRGQIFHEDGAFFGSGYMEALGREPSVTAFQQHAKDTGTPYVELDKSISEYVDACEDHCVKEMYGRMVKVDGDIQVLFPFKRLGHSFIIDSNFDPLEQKRRNEEWRKLIRNMMKQLEAMADPTKPRAQAKLLHYHNALTEQLRVCDNTDESIDRLCMPFPR